MAGSRGWERTRRRSGDVIEKGKCWESRVDPGGESEALAPESPETFTPTNAEAEHRGLITRGRSHPPHRSRINTVISTARLHQRPIHSKGATNSIRTAPANTRDRPAITMFDKNHKDHWKHLPTTLADTQVRRYPRQENNAQKIAALATMAPPTTCARYPSSPSIAIRHATPPEMGRQAEPPGPGFRLARVAVVAGLGSSCC